MATTASPTPLSTSYSSLYRRPSNPRLSRNPAIRPHLRRNSPLAATAQTYESRAPGADIQNLTGDSSDDDVPAPIKFSAAVKALLGEDVSSIDTSPIVSRDGASEVKDEGNVGERRTSREHLDFGAGSASPPRSGNGSPVPRVIRVGSGARPSSRILERDGSFQYQNMSRSTDTRAEHQDLITPAPRTRSIRVAGSRLQSRSPESGGIYGSKGSSGQSKKPGGETSDAEGGPKAEHVETGTVARSRYGDDGGPQSTMRIKRVGKVTGSFLNGPVRRGMIRRQSEEEELPGEPGEHFSGPHNGSPKLSSNTMERRSPKPSEDSGRSPASAENSSANQSLNLAEKPASQHVAFASTATVVPANDEPLDIKRTVSPRTESIRPRYTPGSRQSPPSSKSSGSTMRPVFKVPALPPSLPSHHDQENEPPPTFKRTKPSTGLLGKVNKITVLHDEKDQHATPATASPVRKPLAARSQNTPHRAPPPPPKMSVLEAATTVAGASAASAHSKKKRNYISINGKLFTRLDCIGRGGTSRVYRVMAENYKIFALKRVGLEDADPASIAGFKGEIDLLRKLENSDRVVRLYDYEVNEEKQTLSVLMEVGESDLFRVLNQRIKTEDAKLDLAFTRFYWKEMLECVQAVHQYDIVHSDLKPANFLLVQGRLKLIDFGIANAIADNTVNVHREQQIGTPNYMSPEALIDTNAVGGLPSSAGRLLKLGKPSDVWSLGCILYQMVYGQPPFAHIQKQFERIMSIPNPKVIIEYPSTGVGGVPVPPALIRTLRRCLQRDQTLRPSIEELLSDSNEFLHPDNNKERDADRVAISQEMLGRILHNVVNHCKNRGLPEDAELAKWPEGFFVKIRQALEEEERV